MPQTAASASFKLVRLEGIPEPLLARHVEDGRSGAPHGPSLEAELAQHDWDAAPCFVITRLRRRPTTSRNRSLRSSLVETDAAFAGREEPGRPSASARAPVAYDVRSSWLVRGALAFIGALRRARQRPALSLLDGRLLDDIGVAPEEAAAEARKPPWRE